MKAKTILIPRLQRTGSTLTRFGMLLCMLLVLRSVSAQTNYTPYTFTTISGFANSGLVDGTNTAARFSWPSKIAADPFGNLYVADDYNNAIRMLSPSGTNWVVTTIAGGTGPGTNDGTGGAAQFNNPYGIAVASNGTVYVADSLNDTIRQLTPNGTNWLVATIAGVPTSSGSQNGTNNGAKFSSPSGLTFDGSGNMYVADQYNNDIRKIVQSGTNWVVSRIAGTLGFSGSHDGNPGQFYYPVGVTATTNGTLYVADEVNMSVRMVTGSGVSTPIGTSGVSGSADGTNKAAQFSQFLDICLDQSGNLYIPDTGNNIIRKASAVGTNWVVTTIAGLARFAGSIDGTNSSARFAMPSGFTVDVSGNLYVAGGYENTVRKLSLSGTNWATTTIAGSPGSVGSTDGSGSDARYFGPQGIAIDAAGNVYVSDSRNATIRMINPAGASMTLAGTPQVLGSSDGTNGSALFSFPYGIAVDAATNLYIVDEASNVIRRISPVGTNWVVTTIAGAAGQSGAKDGTNNGARFFHPTAIAVDSATNLYVADTLNSLIRKISPSGTNWIVTTLPISAGNFFLPYGLAVDTQGNIYASDQNSISLYKFSPVGTNWTTSLIAGPGSYLPGNSDGTNTAARFSASLSGIAVDTNGNVYVADTANCTIRRVSPIGTNYEVTTLGGVGSALPYGSGMVGGNDGSGAASRFYQPMAIAVDASGNIFVADSYNNAIRKGVPQPTILLGNPSLSADQVQFAFTLTAGTATSFHLLQSSRPAGPWTTNSSAILTTNVPGVSFNATVPIGGSSEFYRIQTP